MIEGIVVGDILSPTNRRDIIIGMNTTLGEVNGIGRPFVRKYPDAEFDRGSVLTFNLDESRKLHMIICHKLGLDGWVEAEKYLRFGLDHLDQYNDQDRKYSMVNVGTGMIGQRDGANPSAMLCAMANSHLSVMLYVLGGLASERVMQKYPPLRALHAWSPVEGPMAVAA